MSLRLQLRVLLREYDTFVATLLTGALAIFCLFVVPVWGFGPSFLDTSSNGVIYLRGASWLFFATYATGLISLTCFVVFAVTVAVPEEWL